MKVSKKWLNSKNACESGVQYVTEQKLIGLDGKDFVKKLIKLEKLGYADWLVVRLMTHKQQIRYAIYAAEQVIKIYEDKYPDDKRPKEAIEAAKAYLKRPTKANKDKAYAAAYAANAANAANAAYAKEMKTKIIKYGLRLIGDK